MGQPAECRHGINGEAPTRRKRGQSLRSVWRSLRRLAVIVLGIAVVLVGVVMIVTPGPAIVVIPVGLAMLGVRFDWLRQRARRFQHWLRGVASRDGVRRVGSNTPLDLRTAPPNRAAPVEEVDSRST